jgi:hypothetical protein
MTIKQQQQMRTILKNLFGKKASVEVTPLFTITSWHPLYGNVKTHVIIKDKGNGEFFCQSDSSDYHTWDKENNEKIRQFLSLMEDLIK